MKAIIDSDNAYPVYSMRKATEEEIAFLEDLGCSCPDVPITILHRYNRIMAEYEEMQERLQKLK